MALADSQAKRRALRALAAAIAALAAAIGDFLMLSVVHAAPWTTHSQEFAKAIAWLGGLLGFFLIPLYYVGYATAVELLVPLPAKLRVVLVGTTAGTALLGAVAHALNAANISDALTTGVPLPSPIDAIIPRWAPFFIVGTAATMCAVTASAVYCWATWRYKRTDAYAPAFSNPITGTAVLLILGSPSRALLDYLAFVGPNLAHSIFFLICYRSTTKRAGAANA